jgi:TonB family protein
VIAFVLAWTLAATAVVDTTVRIPGTSLRFGMESARFGAAQGFVPSTAQIRPGREGRDGALRFFGIDSRVTLQFENRRLVEAGFVIEQASPRQISYLEDDLRRRGYHRGCVTDDTESSVCDWTGHTALRLEITGQSVSASIQPLRSIFSWDSSEADTLTPAAALRAPEGVRVHRDTLTLQSQGQGGPRPEVLHAPGRPRFPESARRAGVQGIVFVLALVDTTGEVIETVIRRGIVELNDAALPVAQDYLFEPLIVDGRKIRYWIEVPIRFTMH